MITKYAHTFRYPKFLNQRGDVMPNTGGWQDKHRDALIAPRGFEVAIVGMISAWASYADRHRARYESGIGDDGVLGPAWIDLGRAIRTLLNGETGRLDCGTLVAFLCDTLKSEGFES